jgi:hypothetical protein
VPISNHYEVFLIGGAYTCYLILRYYILEDVAIEPLVLQTQCVCVFACV